MKNIASVSNIKCHILLSIVTGCFQDILCVSQHCVKKLPVKAKPLLSFHNFATAEEIDEYTNKLAKIYPNLTEVAIIGWTHEERPIKAVKVSNSPPVGSEKPIILIDAGFHAREWAAPAVGVYILNQLVENYSKNENLVNTADWIVVPLVNPDGYAYSMTHERLWRKNRANYTNNVCVGVDLNRNFDVNFGGDKESLASCSETYCGPSAFSEPETQALRDLALDYKNKIHFYITLHSYGKLILYPWSYTNNLPEDWEDLDSMAKEGNRAMSKIYGTKYTIGSASKLLGKTSGGSDDWMKLKGGAKYSYTIELPPALFVRNGFEIPTKYILPMSQELFTVIAAFAKEVKSRCSSSYWLQRRSPGSIQF